MKNKNIFKSSFFILILILVPLMITIVAASWIMLSEDSVKPVYNPDSAFYYYLNGQSATYDGSEHFPEPRLPGSTTSDPNLLNLDKNTISWTCYKNTGTTDKPVWENNNGKPVNAGEYYFQFKDSDDESSYGASSVFYTIDKAAYTITDWPSLNDMYWGNSYTFKSSDLGDTSKGSFSVVTSSLAFDTTVENNRSNSILKYTVNIKFTLSSTYSNNYYVTEDTETVSVGLKAVAHVSTTFYATVDEAITSTSSGTIYVMLTDSGSDIAKTIGATTTNTTITLATGVTLYVPYYMDTSTSPYKYNISLSETQSDSSNLHEFGELYHASASNFADSVANNTNLKNYIIIDSDTTLSITKGATLQVTGIIGSTSQGLQGHTSSLYSEIKMISGSKIDNFGVIICGGYIKEVKYNENNELIYTTYSKEVSTKPYLSEIIIQNLAEIRLPFVVSDYRGGTSTAGAYANTSAVNVLGGNYTGNISPFSRYDFPNVQTRIKVIYGGFIKGYADLYTGAFKIDIPFIGEVGTDEQHNLTDILAIGNTSDSLIQIKSGTIVYCDCVPTNPGITTTSFNSRKTYISMIGTYGASLNYMLMEVNVVDTIAVTTEDVLFPVSDLFDISLSDGEYNINTGFKLLPGSSLTVNFGATLNVGSDFIVYSDFNDKAVISPKYPTKEQLGKAGADLIINGTLNINSGATFGGIVKTQGAQAKMNVNTTNLTITSKEGTGSRSGLSFVFNESNSITEKLKAYIYKNGTIDNYTTTLSQGTYHSKEGTPGNYGWYSDNATIYYDANGGTLTGDFYEPIDGTSYTTPYEIKKINTTNPVRDHYVFYGWYADPNCTIPVYTYDPTSNEYTAYKYSIYCNTYVYAKWIPIDYNIEYFYIYHEDAPNNGDIYESSLYETFNDLTNVSLIKPKHSLNYVFDGWYLDEELEQPIGSLDGSLYVDKGSLSLYGRWYPAGTKVYVIDYIIVNNSSSSIDIGFASQETIVSANASQYVYPANYTDLNEDTSKSYYFDGWFVDQYCTIEFDKSTHLSSGSTVIKQREVFDENGDNVLDENGNKIIENYIEIYCKFADKAKVTTINYRPSTGDELGTRSSIYIIPGTYNPYDLANSSITNIKNAFVTKTNFGGDYNYQFYGYGTSSETKQSLTSLTFSNAVENNNVYLHYLLLVKVSVSSSMNLGRSGLTSISKWKLDENIYFYIDTNELLIGKYNENEYSSTTTIYYVTEGTTYRTTSGVTKRDYKNDSKSVSVSPSSGTIGTDAEQTISIKIS